MVRFLHEVPTNKNMTEIILEYIPIASKVLIIENNVIIKGIVLNATYSFDLNEITYTIRPDSNGFEVSSTFEVDSHDTTCKIIPIKEVELDTLVDWLGEDTNE